MHRNVFISMNCRMREAHSVDTCLLLLQNVLVKFPGSKFHKCWANTIWHYRIKFMFLSICSVKERRGRKKLTLERIWSQIFPRTSGRQMARVWNCRIAYKVETQTSIHRCLFQEMRAFFWMLFSLGLSLGLREIHICWAHPSEVWETKGHSVSWYSFSCVESLPTCELDEKPVIMRWWITYRWPRGPTVIFLFPEFLRDDRYVITPSPDDSY